MLARLQLSTRYQGFSYHIIYDPHCLAYGACLETHVVHATDQIIHRNRSPSKLIKIQLFDFLRAFWHAARLDQDCAGRRRRGSACIVQRSSHLYFYFLFNSQQNLFKVNLPSGSSQLSENSRALVAFTLEPHPSLNKDYTHASTLSDKVLRDPPLHRFLTSSALLQFYDRGGIQTRTSHSLRPHNPPLLTPYRAQR
jgi:hypothetical protein